MAGEQGNRTSCSEDEIQSMVRGIFGQLFEGRQLTQSMQHGTISSGINQAFHLPRNINTSNTSTTIAVEGEPGPGPSQPVSLPQQSLTLSVPSIQFSTTVMLIWVVDLAQFDRAEVELGVAQTCKVMVVPLNHPLQIETSYS
ncbi:Hypothetical predicted protein [Paramuricea clavata]|uniref:Uncharacterized protein n=1 Tax=Paramuricea clavata TaxID=317549 RepID=A0A6S7I6W6_PARCT|nr:Hypothetical predicted protein [Paramuricea clavata]